MILRTLVVLALAACASAPPQAPQKTLFTNLAALCGKSFTGRLDSTEAADADFAGKRLVIGVVDCAQPDVVRIPFAVGADRSRTWVVTQLADGRLRLKHDHRHADGSEDALSQYGGETAAPGDATRQDFPVDEYSKDLFARENRAVSMTNVWTIELKPGETFAYELNRANRHFRVVFDLTRPL